MKISIKQYSQTLFDLTDGKSEQDVLATVKKFAQLLKKDGQLKNASKIMEKFSDLHNEAHGIIVTEVCGRGDVSQNILDDIKEFVKRKYNAKEVEMNYRKDEKIQGGVIIRVGDEVMDGSIQKQLTNLKKVLASK